MSHFRVWAPDAGRVELQTARPGQPPAVRPMHPASAPGWWAADAPDAPAGTDYGYRLDGGPPLADPRSPRQPFGSNGLSRSYDHSAFSWTDRGWRGAPLRGAVIYEMHLGTFTPTGTFDTAIERLDHLRDLGVGAVELMPVASFPGSHGWGYDGIGLWAVHEPYGGPDALKRFVDACHQRGLAVFLDVVYNHVGPGHRGGHVRPPPSPLAVGCQGVAAPGDVRLDLAGGRRPHAQYGHVASGTSSATGSARVRSPSGARGSP